MDSVVAHQLWNAAMETSVMLPSIADMIQRRSLGRNAVQQKEIRTAAKHIDSFMGYPFSVAGINDMVDALIAHCAHVDCPPRQQMLLSGEAAEEPGKREAQPAPVQQMLQATTWAHVASDAQFVLSMLWALLCGLWQLGRTVGNVTVELSPALLLIACTVGAVAFIAALPAVGLSGAALATWAWVGA